MWILPELFKPIRLELESINFDRILSILKLRVRFNNYGDVKGLEDGGGGHKWMDCFLVVELPQD